MKDIVTFETAARLKEAGFPQPTPEAGQFWYNPNGILFVVYLVHEIVELYEIGRRNPSIGNYWENWTFAPTATDILREMPGCILAVENFYKEKVIVGVYYEVWKTGRLWADHGNPAEAAAEAWIEFINKNPFVNAGNAINRLTKEIEK